MDRFNYENIDNNDPRVQFANKVCFMIFLAAGGDIDSALKRGEDIFKGFDENIRNFYEIIEQSVPLVGLYQLRRYGAKNYDFTEEEWLAAKKRAEELIVEMYGDAPLMP